MWAKCDDLHTCCDVIHKAIHRYRCVCHLCDDTDTVAVMSNRVGELSDIDVCSHESRMGDIIYILYDVINIIFVTSNIEGCDVIKGSC